MAIRWHSVCEVCKQSVFDPNLVFAYQIRDKAIVPISLKGRDPWAGVRVVCNSCIKILGREVIAG